MMTGMPHRTLGRCLVVGALWGATACSTAAQDSPKQGSAPAGGDQSNPAQGSGGSSAGPTNPSGATGGKQDGATGGGLNNVAGTQQGDRAGQSGSGGNVVGGGGASSSTGGVSPSAGGAKGQGGSTVIAGKGGAAGSGDSKPVDAGAPVQTSGCGVAADTAVVGKTTTYNIDVDGTSRKYVVWVPAKYDANHPYRLVFAWHGLGGTAEQIACGYGTGQCRPSFYGLQPLANDTAIFVAGQGLDSGNDAGTGWPNSNGRDIAFVRALLDWIKPRYCIDETRIFSVGMSYGGVMSNTVGCELGDQFRAIAPASGMGPGFGRMQTKCTGQVAAWIAHGTQDTTVSFDSGVASRDFWLQRNHCGTTTTAASVAPCVDYQGCDPQYPVTWCQFDGGHTIPSFEAKATWDFLQQF